MATHQIVRASVAKIFADFDRNFRSPEHDYGDCLPTDGYDHDKFLAGKAKQGLFESILHNGVITPIWVAVLTASQIAEIIARRPELASNPPEFRVIRGHKRFRTVCEINTRFAGKIEVLDVDAYSGLSELEEWSLLADHGTTQRETPLTEEGEYRAVVHLFGAGFSQEKIAGMFGQKRGWAMRRVWVNDMGRDTPIETHYLQRFNPKAEKGSFFTFPLSDVDKLHPAWKADRDGGKSPMEAESAFYRLWTVYGETGKQPAEPKSLTRKVMDERGGFIEGRPALEELLKFASGRGGNAKTAADMYDRLNVKAEKAEALTADLATAEAEKATLADRLATAEARVAELTAENEALRAELIEARKPVTAPGKPNRR